MSTNRLFLPDLNEMERQRISRLTQIIRDGEAKREREKNWKEYTSKDGSMIISYEIEDHSYDDEFGRVEKFVPVIRRVMADVTTDENYSGLIEDLRIEIEAEHNE